MPTPVEIVIRARDEFSPAFAALDGALRRTEGAGREAGGALEGVGVAFARVGEAAGSADAALGAFVSGAEQRLGALDAGRETALADMVARHEEAARTLSERLLAQEEGAAAQREGRRQTRQAQERAATAAHHAELLAMEGRFGQQLQALDAAVAQARLQTFQRLLASLHALAQAHGGALARSAKALAVAEALVSAYLAGNKALASVPFPFNLAAAAAVTAQGLATVERIRQVNVAHGGLEAVPEDGTFLLQRGERVLSAGQNRELTRFLASTQGEGAAEGGVTIENLTVHVLEHATSAEALLTMERSQLRQVVTERLIPMLDELARLGIRPHFVEENT